MFLCVPSVFAEDVTVSTSSELVNALSNSQYSGIVLNDGDYFVSGVNITRDVSIRAISNSTSISGGSGYIFNVYENNSLSLSGLTVKDTSASGSGLSSPIVSSGFLTIRDCIFSGNSGVSGGVLTVSGGETLISSSSFVGNVASANGGVVNHNGGVLTVNSSIFVGNRANRLGGVINSVDVLYVLNSYFESNNAPVGGVLSSSYYNVIRGSRFVGNNANTSGGAVYSTGNLNVRDSSFTGNIASYGGAVSFSSSSMSTNITSSNFTGNRADFTIVVGEESFGGTGGALYSEGVLNVMYSIFDSNEALYEGGAISYYEDGSGIVNYNIFRGNTALYPQTISVDNRANVNLDYNWWASNNPFTSNLIGEYNSSKDESGLSDVYDYYSPSNWIVLSASMVSTTNVNVPVTFTSKLQVRSYNGGFSDFTGTLPSNLISFQANGGNLNPESAFLTNTVSTTFVSGGVGLYTVTATLDDEKITLPVIVQPSNITSLYDTNITPNSFTINPGENITVNVLSDGLTVNTGSIRFSLNGELLGVSSVSNGVCVFNTGLSYGSYSILAEYLAETPFKSSSAVLAVNIVSVEDNTFVSLFDLTKVYLGPENLTGSLLTIYGEPVMGMHLSLTLTRLSNMMSKVYDVVTDYQGVFSLPINLASGEYGASVSFNGFNNLTPASNSSFIHVLVEEDNRTGTWFNASDYTKSYNESGNFTGYLLSVNNTALLGQHVGLTLTRLSNGLSKTYDTVTDYTGLFSLSINLAPGLYSVLCSFDGVSDYQPASTTCTITVI